MNGLSDYYTESVQDRLVEEAGEPLLACQFTVYRHEHKLIYVKGVLVARLTLRHESCCT